MNLKEYLNQIHNDKEKLAALKAAAEAGKDKEFLAAEGVEVSNELNDNELSAVAGGIAGVDSVGGTTITTIYRTDSRGNPTHWKRTHTADGSYSIYHYECKECGRVLHLGSLDLYYCDPCDNWYIFLQEVIDQQG